MKFKINRNVFTFFKDISSLFFVGVIAIILSGCANDDYQKMRGVWETKLSDNKSVLIMIEDDTFVFLNTPNNNDRKYKFTLDSSKNPRQFIVKEFEDGKDFRGIYELSGEGLKVAFAKGFNDPIPNTFTMEETYLFDRKGNPK